VSVFVVKAAWDGVTHGTANVCSQRHCIEKPHVYYCEILRVLCFKCHSSCLTVTRYTCAVCVACDSRGDAQVPSVSRRLLCGGCCHGQWIFLETQRGTYRGAAGTLERPLGVLEHRRYVLLLPGPGFNPWGPCMRTCLNIFPHLLIWICVRFLTYPHVR
jgi:hypothetical protein